MKKSTSDEIVVAAAIGLDLSDVKGNWYAIDAKGQKVGCGEVRLRKEAVESWARRLTPTLIAIEAGGNSAWVSRTLTAAGHEVIVANPVKVALITKNTAKADDVDAEYLARLARFDRKLLHEVRHRGEQTQTDLQVIRSRDTLVRTRTRLITHVRGAVKSFGARLPGCGTATFHRVAREHTPAQLRDALMPVIAMIEMASQRIRSYDREIEKRVEEQYPEARRLMQVGGVGALTALAYVLVLEDVKRFTRSRAVGAYVGLTPRRDQSGRSDPERGISSAGDELLRRLLVQSAQYILGPFGKDCDLRRHGERIAERGGKKAKRRAVIAVARKLSVLLHRLWRTGDLYQPLLNSLRRAA